MDFQICIIRCVSLEGRMKGPCQTMESRTIPYHLFPGSSGADPSLLCGQRNGMSELQAVTVRQPPQRDMRGRKGKE